MRAFAAEIDDVRSARSVNISQPDMLLIELIGGVEPGGIVHRDFGAEATITQVGPITHFAVADADQIGQPVRTHVG